MRLAFIGLGRMGVPIATNLIKAGHTLTVFNRTPGKAEALTELGAVESKTAAGAVRECEVAFTMLADDAAAQSIVLEPNGLVAALPPGAVHVSLSTISVAMTRKLAAEHAARQQVLVSATVFGRPDAAAAARLLVVAAGPSQALETVRPLLQSIGRQTIEVGPEPWHANLIKLNGNFMIAAMLETLGEAFATIRKAGVDQHLFLEIMTELFGSPLYKNYGATIADQKFEPAAFALELGYKDIRLGLEAAGELNVPTPIAGVLRDHFLTAIALGQAQMDWSSIGIIPARLAGLETIKK